MKCIFLDDFFLIISAGKKIFLRTYMLFSHWLKEETLDYITYDSVHFAFSKDVIINIEDQLPPLHGIIGYWWTFKCRCVVKIINYENQLIEILSKFLRPQVIKM